MEFCRRLAGNWRKKILHKLFAGEDFAFHAKLSELTTL